MHNHSTFVLGRGGSLELAERYTRTEAGRILGLEPNRLRYWERLRLICPEARWGQRFYSFIDLVALRSLQRLTQNHVPARKVRRAMTLIEKQFGSADRAAAPTSPGRPRPRNSRGPAGLGASVQSFSETVGLSLSTCPRSPPNFTPWPGPRPKIFSAPRSIAKPAPKLCRRPSRIISVWSNSRPTGSKRTSISACAYYQLGHLTDARNAFLSRRANRPAQRHFALQPGLHPRRTRRAR